jgi:synaptosomal-associated protein 25
VAKITNDAREEEMEENMEQVSAMIGNLRNMANDMGGELENQNSQLERINMKASSDITRVKMANDKAASLMK